MSDQCKGCELRGNIQQCEALQKLDKPLCPQSQSWYVQLIKQQRDELIEAAKTFMDWWNRYHANDYKSAMVTEIENALAKAGAL